MTRSGALLLVPLLSAVLASCAPAAAPAAATLPPVSPSPAPTASLATEDPSVTPGVTAQPLPAEIMGKWESGEIALEIKQGSYSTVHMALARGRLEVDGDGLAFSNSTLCAGIGRYRWSVEGNELTFESIEPDECPGRAAGLDGITYTRVE